MRAASGSSTGIIASRRATRFCACTPTTPPSASASSEQAHAARLREIGAEDLFPEFDVSDFAGLPADEAYEAETDLGGSPSRLRLVSEWRRQIQPNASSRAIDIVRASAPFRELRGQGRVRPAGLGDLEPAEWSPPCESGHVRWALDVWYLLTFNGMVGRGAGLPGRPRRASGRARTRLPVPRRLIAALTLRG